MTQRPVLHDIPEPVAAQAERLPLGMQLRMAVGAIRKAAELVGLEDAREVQEWITNLSYVVDRAEYDAAVARHVRQCDT